MVEHTYEGLSGQTERTVRVELIHEDGNTRLCARNLHITVRPSAAPESEDPPPVLFSFNGELSGPAGAKAEPEQLFWASGSGPTTVTEDGVKFTFSINDPVVVCPSGLGLAGAFHATSIASTVRATDSNGLAYFTGGTSTIGGENASNP